MPIKKAIQEHYKEALLKSIIGTLSFIIFIFIFNNYEIVRDQIEDPAFDFINYIYLDTQSVNIEQAPNIVLLQVDNRYLRKNKLLNEHNTTNYGYLFPREKIVEFISKIDKLPLSQQPIALFIDYDMSYTSIVGNKKRSTSDNNLLDILKKERKYTILIPKISVYNYIEEYILNLEDEELRRSLQKRILFVSAWLQKNKDGYTRRYTSSKTFNSKKYEFAPLKLWQLSNNEILQDSDTVNNLIANRIVLKSYADHNIAVFKDKNTFIRKRSYWKNLYVYSANYPLSDINLKDSIIMLGANYEQNEDIFSINASLTESKLSGIEMLSNALMTLFYFDGKLKRLDWQFSIPLVFSLFFVVELILEVLFNRYNIKSKEFEFFILLIVMAIVMLTVSVFLLTYFKVWFNWFIPVVLFQVYEYIEMIRRLILKKQKKKGTIK